MAESLLPGTDAIQKGVLEIGGYRDGWLVRGKTLDNVPHQRIFKKHEGDAAFAYFLKKVTELRAECAQAKLDGRFKDEKGSDAKD